MKHDGVGVEQQEMGDALRKMANRLASVGPWSVDLLGEVTFWPEETQAIFGVKETPSVDEAIGFYAPEYRASLRRALNGCISTGAPFSQEAELVTPTGKRRWLQVQGEAVYGEGGEMVGVQGVVQDITEVRNIRAAMQASEERFRLLSMATNDVLWVWEVPTGDLWRSTNMEHLFGFCRDEVEPTREWWFERLHPDDARGVQDSLNDATEEGRERWEGTYRFRQADGTYAVVLDRAHITYDAEGAPLRLFGGMTDLTHRKRVEAQLAETTEVLDQARDAILIRDLAGRVKYMNQTAEVLYGWSRADALGVNVKDLGIYENPSVFDRLNEQVMESGSWVGELGQVRSDGQGLLVEGRWTLLRSEDGVANGVLAINTDISERKRLQQQLMRRQRLESVGTLAGGIAHDLNNVLTPILFSIDGLRAGEADPERLEDLETIETCARRGSQMISQLLAFAKGYEGTQEETALKEVVAELTKILREVFPKTIEIRESMDGSVWPVLGNQTQLHQVLMNLCVNARDAMKDGGVLEIALENVVLDEDFVRLRPKAELGGYVVIRVKDTGVGIPPEVLERVFEPFFTTKGITEGTGLGLSTTHSIVESHGGFINVYSEEGRGTTFHVYLPAAVSSEDARQRARETHSLPHGRGERVLVVDDEEAIRQLLRRTLQRFGYTVKVAKNGAEALAMVAKDPGAFDLILTDMVMPVMDGVALIAALKHLRSQIPVIGASGLENNTRLPQAKELGMKRFISKPFSAERLLRELREVLDEV